MNRIAMCCAALLAVGCMSHRFYAGKGATFDDDNVYGGWQSHFLWGLIGDPEIDVAEHCKSGNAMIDERTTVTNSLVSLLTLFLYNPTTVDIYCRAGT